MLDNIIYNRSERRYELDHEGDTYHFPAGRDGRQDAFQTAVRLQSRALYEAAWSMIQQEPALESRVWKAAEIILNSEVTIIDSGNVLALVASQSEYGSYTLQMVNGLIACDCLDFEGGTAVYTEGNEQPLCKHILALQLSQITALETAV